MNNHSGSGPSTGRREAFRNPFVAKASDGPKQKWYRIENVKSNAFDSDSFSNESTSDEADVFIYEAIGGWWGVEASQFIREIKALDVKKINLHLNSPGGDVFDGVAIYNALRSHKAEIHAIVDSLAASAASFIAMSGDKITMRNGSMMMIHDALSLTYGNEEDHISQAELLSKISNNIAEIYAKRAGGTAASWRDVMKAEAWYTASEAVEEGLADEVEGEGESPTNRWDLSVFNFAGRDNAPSPKLVKQSVMNNRRKENLVDRDEKTPDEDVVTDGTVEVDEVAEEEDVKIPGVQDSARKPSAGVRVLVNGVPTSGIDAIQNHINTLEAFYNNAKKNERSAFVDSLLSSRKISAPQAESFLNLVDVENMTETQFEMFKASYDNAPELPFLAKHGMGNVKGPQDSGSTEAKAAALEEIEILREVVATHKRAGKTDAQIAEYSAYKRLVELEKSV